MMQARALVRARALNLSRQPVLTRRMATATETATASSKPKGPNRASQFSIERNEIKHHAAESSELWRKLSIYAVVPALILASVNAYNLWNEHWEHESHKPPVEERPEYPYQNIRTKSYFWGDGDKTLFWNDEINHHKKD